MEVSQTVSKEVKALQCYEKQLARIRKYNEIHREELKEKSKEYFQKIKADPERYKLYKEKKRKSYKENKMKMEELEKL